MIDVFSCWLYCIGPKSHFYVYIINRYLSFFVHEERVAFGVFFASEYFMKIKINQNIKKWLEEVQYVCFIALYLVKTKELIREMSSKETWYSFSFDLLKSSRKTKLKYYDGIVSYLNKIMHSVNIVIPFCFSLSLKVITNDQKIR